MRNEDLLLNGSGEGQVLEQFEEQIEYLIVILGLHFALETVNLVHIFGLVVATQEGYGRRVGHPEK